MKKRVLLADDAAAVRTALSLAIAQDQDLEVAGTAANGRVALEIFSALKPDIVLLDFEMTEMDGLATVREIRKKDSRVPIIMFSNLTERGAAVTLEALSLGVTDYVPKPSNADMTATLEAISRRTAPQDSRSLPSPRTAQPAGPGGPAETAGTAGPHFACTTTAVFGANCGDWRLHWWTRRTGPRSAFFADKFSRARSHCSAYAARFLRRCWRHASRQSRRCPCACASPVNRSGLVAWSSLRETFTWYSARTMGVFVSRRIKGQRKISAGRRWMCSSIRSPEYSELAPWPWFSPAWDRTD